VTAARPITGSGAAAPFLAPLVADSHLATRIPPRGWQGGGRGGAPGSRLGARSVRYHQVEQGGPGSTSDCGGVVLRRTALLANRGVRQGPAAGRGFQPVEAKRGVTRASRGHRGRGSPLPARCLQYLLHACTQQLAGGRLAKAGMGRSVYTVPTSRVCGRPPGKAAGLSWRAVCSILDSRTERLAYTLGHPPNQAARVSWFPAWICASPGARAGARVRGERDRNTAA
jgi:hypothetical protein